MAKKKDCGWDLACHAANINPDLGKTVKALAEPYKQVTAVVAQSMKGTPLENATKALSLGSQGKITEASKAAVAGALDIVTKLVPGLEAVPFVGVAKEMVSSMVGNAISPGKQAQQVVLPVPDLNKILKDSGNPALASLASRPGEPKAAGAVPQRAAPAAPKAGVAAVLNNQGTKLAATAPAPSAPAMKRKPRSFTKQSWAAFVADPRSVGGTQQWTVPG